MSAILLIRHATCDGLGARLNGRRAGVRLNAQGRGEAMRLADRLAGSPIHLTLTSPRERCVETAEAIAGTTKSPIEVDQNLDEVDFGAWTGLAFEELAQDPAWRHWNEQRSVARAPGGEAMADVQMRMRRALSEAARLPGGIVALVTHAEPIRAAIAGLLGFSLDAWARLEISPAGVTRLAEGPHGLRLCCVNESVG